MYELDTQGVGMEIPWEGRSDTWAVGVDVNRMNSPSLSQGKQSTSVGDPDSVHILWLRHYINFAESSNTEICGARDSAAKFEVVGSTTSPRMVRLDPVRISRISYTPQMVNIILLGE